MTVRREIAWKQGETLSVFLPTAVSLVGRTLRCHVRRRVSDSNPVLIFESAGPTDQRVVAETGGVRITLGASTGAAVNTGGKDAVWQYSIEAELNAQDVLRVFEGPWVVSADPTRTGAEEPPTPTSDARYLRSAQIVAGSNVTIALAGSGADLTLTFSATGGGGDSVAWGDITGKPATFPPAGHSHAAEDITSGTLTAARLPLPGLETLGGVMRNAGAAGQYVTGINSSGQLTYDTPAGGSSGGAPNVRWIGAGELIPRVTDGAGIDGQEFSTNRQNIDYLSFDPGAVEYAQASFTWPGSATTATAIIYWTAASGSGSVVWRAALRCYADDDAIDQAFGTSQSVTDALLSANDVHQSAATSAIAPAGSAADKRLTILQIDRHATAGGDTLAVDARLIGVLMEFS